MIAAIQIANGDAAIAQDASSPTSPEGTAASLPDDGVQEIVVTAQRRDQRLQDVPISMAVVGGDDLAAKGIAGFSDLAPTIPNFSMSRSPAGHAITMRGVGASTGSPSLEQSIVTFVDGVYGGNIRQFTAPFLDVERIEVLRGPQGALVGKNTVAGAINIISRRPDAEFGGFVDANYDFLLDGPSIEGAVNVPLSDGLAMRLVGSYADIEGYMYNELTDRDEPLRRELIGRASLGYESGPLRLYAKYEHADVDGAGNMIQVWSPQANYRLDYRKTGFATDRPEQDDMITNAVVLQADLEWDWATLTSISAYSGFRTEQHLDSDWTPVDGAISDFNMDLDQLSEEIRLVSATGRAFDYAGGILFQHSELFELRTSGVLFAPAASNFRTFDQETRDISVYGQAGYNFGAFRLQGSLRYTNVRKTANYKRFTGPQSLQFIGTQVRDFDGEITNDLWDPAVVLQYRPDSSLMMYASFQKGSKSGGFQGAIANAEPFSFEIDPESSTSYEVGTKFQFGRRSYLNVAAFHTTYDDLQVSTAIPSPDGLSSPFFTANAGTARVVGVEFDSLLNLSRAFDLAINGAWNPTAKFTEFRSGPCVEGQVRNGDRPGSCNLEGLRLSYSAKFLGSVTARYRQDVTDDLRLTLSTTASYRGSARTALEADVGAIQDEFVKLDARIGVGASDGRWELGLVARNLTDILTLQNGSSGGLSRTILRVTDARNVSVDPPRQVLATASFKF